MQRHQTSASPELSAASENSCHALALNARANSRKTQFPGPWAKTWSGSLLPEKNAMRDCSVFVFDRRVIMDHPTES